MNKLQLTCASTVASVSLAIAADSTTLRPGLWELTFKSDLSLEQARRLSVRMPQSWSGRIPAPQRAELKRLYENGELLRTALNTSDTVCITEEDLEHGIQPTTDIDESCSVVATTTHPSWQHLQLVCKGLEDDRLGKAAITINAVDPTTLTGTITRTVAGTAKPFSIRVELHGKWLDSECGEQAAEEDEPRPH